MAIHNLTLAVIIGCILVVFVLIAFLFQWRAALVSLLAIPLSLGAAAIVLSAMGTTINTMILAGFAVAVGVVVDDAIIDMENIVRRLRAWRAEGKKTTPLHLVLAASLEVRVAIFYATIINIVAVIPVMVVGGLTGRVLPAAGDRLRPGGAGVDAGRADRHAGPRPAAAVRRAAGPA